MDESYDYFTIYHKSGDIVEGFIINTLHTINLWFQLKEIKVLKPEDILRNNKTCHLNSPGKIFMTGFL